jgi:hypothetical protein
MANPHTSYFPLTGDAFIDGQTHGFFSIWMSLELNSYLIFTPGANITNYLAARESRINQIRTYSAKVSR